MAKVDTRPIVHTDPEIMSGAPVFVGTRVPLDTLRDYMVGNYRLEEFLDHFPSVSREQAVAAIEEGLRRLIPGAHTP